MKRLLKSRKALSPVVAAIILIAVTVAVSIAVAAWMGALTFTFMGYEKMQINRCTWNWDATAANRVINITVANTGTKDLTVTSIKVNYVTQTAVDPSPSFAIATDDTPLVLLITYPYANGTAYDISIVTSGGYEFTDHFVGGIPSL
jgi:flagellin-like protein